MPRCAIYVAPSSWSPAAARLIEMLGDVNVGLGRGDRAIEDV